MPPIPDDHEARIRKLMAKQYWFGATGAGRPRPNLQKRTWCIETGQEFPSRLAAAESMQRSHAKINRAIRTGEAVNGHHFSSTRPTPEKRTLAMLQPLTKKLPAALVGSAEDAAALLAQIRAIVAVLAVMLASFSRGSVTYLVDIDTRALPVPAVGNYQARFFLTDQLENSSQAKTADGFQIDGDVQKDYSHYWADQITLPLTPPIPENFYLTLNGTEGSPDYFFLSIVTPDGGVLDAADGSQWLAWAAMDQNSPTLHLDLPEGMAMTSAAVPELSANKMMVGGAFIAIGLVLLWRERP